MLILLLVLAVVVHPTWAVLPQFSWDTLSVFFHSPNSSGHTVKMLFKQLPSFRWLTIGYDVKDVDDEDEMVLAMKAIKAVNPKITTYFYMNSFKDRPEMTRMAREFDQHPDYALCDSNGNKVRIIMPLIYQKLKCVNGEYLHECN